MGNKIEKSEKSNQNEIKKRKIKRSKERGKKDIDIFV
jgi:hypothetical protein